MSQPQDVFADAGDEVAEPIEFPEVVAAFEELGFVRLGRLRRSNPGSLWREAAAYPKAVRTDYVTHRAAPSVVLAAPDHSAFVTVTWWWGMPDVRLRTLLSDGSVVETVRAWDHVPVVPRGYGRVYRDGDLRQEQLLTHAPAGGRRMALAEGSSADLWSAHRQHVSATTTEPGTVAMDHDSMRDALVLSNRLARHHVACHRAQVRHGLSVLAAVLVPGVAAIAAALLLPPLADLVFLVVVVVALVLVIAFRRRIRAWSLRRRYDTRSRPALGD